MDDQRIESIVTDYIKHKLSPTKAEQDHISNKYKELQSFLPGRTFQTGSYARLTSTTPVNDLDVIYELPESVSKKMTEAKIDPNVLNMADILGTLADALQKEYLKTATVKAQLHSVGIFFGSEDEFSIDVVPAIPCNDGMYWVPETAHLSVARRRKLYESYSGLNWIKSDPEGYKKQAKNTDIKSNGRFRKSAKFVKKWCKGCKENDTAFSLKSFHLELLVTELFKANSQLTVWRAIEQFFNELGGSISSPQLADRADASRFIDEYLGELNSTERQCILNEQQKACDIVLQLNSAQTQAEVLNGIESLLMVGRTQSRGPIVGVTSTNPEISKPYLWHDINR